ncbi:DUF4129 domain-containing protein [Lacibacter sp. H407]|uniref:DUF4129 domain-containing protein n=1 Tax=Lacibacter sp. H407 TaxID=3133423 RepID=UPI0030C5FD03
MSKSLKHVWLILLLLTGAVVSTYAQEMDTVVVEAPVAVDTTAVTDEEYYEDDDEEEIAADTSLVQSYWTYPMDSIQRIKKDKDFAYAAKLDSLLRKRQEMMLKKQKEQSPDKEPVDIFPIVRTILWILLIGALLFVLYRVFLSDRGLFASPTRNKQLEVEDEPVTDEIYLDQQLNEAIRNKNYRLAIRFLYLQSLSRLAEKGWLQLSPDKTNYQYVRELAKPQLKQSFARITLHYEYAWYGDFNIAADVFEPVKQEFDQFHQSIKQH